MAFDQPTRNRLSRFVGDARALLTAEFTAQLQHQYGLDPASGAEADLDHLQLDDARLATARLLRETLRHYLAGSANDGAQTADKAKQQALERIAREQAFTVLNRLCALRMAEARGLLIESVARGYQSKGFQLYARLAGSALGETGDAYRCYLFSVFDEVALDLPVLFDRFSPQGRLFPREAALLQLLSLLNAADLEPLWAEDETIGWIYQYFNSVEERRQMRAESQAPRNSRELAVRNQFFTPRYVVEFLTDNTLGRTWYEMTRGQTALRDTCRYLVRRPNEIFLAPNQQPPDVAATNPPQDELLKQPVYIPHRPIKDPREIKMLDPACGSMHFGLYAFDLFERIYEEAWDLQASGAWPSVDCRLSTDYSSKQALLRDVPRLIIEHNIHGIDIDPRAVQIAGLSLWLRAQKSWQAQGVKAGQRPVITRSNVVCAEPMPGERQYLDEFVKDHLGVTPEGRLLGQLVRQVFDAMQLAGEAGSLLKIEEEIAGTLAEARQRWMDMQETPEQGRLFGDEPVRQMGLGLDVAGIAGEGFWAEAEERIYAALRAYAEQAESDSYQHRLFADDAARGFAFIDVCRKRYDVVLMNPPFGDRIPSCEDLFGRQYGVGNLDLYHYFYERATGISTNAGRVGAITPRTLLYQSHYWPLRNSWLAQNPSLIALVELDLGILDSATVRPVLVVLDKCAGDSRTFYCNLKHASEPGIDLMNATAEFVTGSLAMGCTFHRLSRFVDMPGARFSLWASQGILDSFRSRLTLEPSLGKVTEGLTNEDDMRFLRCWWEVQIDDRGHWRPFGKFDTRSTFVPDFSIVIDWSISGYSMLGEVGNQRANETYYFQPGIAFTRSCEVGMAATILPAGLVFSGVSRFLVTTYQFILGLLAYLNTRVVEGLHVALTPDRDRISGTLRKLPIIISLSVFEELHSPGREIWASKYLWLQQHDETFRGFSGVSSCSPSQVTKDYVVLSERISEAERFIERIVRTGCSLSDSDLAILDSEVNERVGERDLVICNPSFTTKLGATIQIITGCLACSLGRWDVRYATGEKPAPDLPDPFAPLPVCPPGMLQNAQGLPATPADVPTSYPLRISWPGILVDDGGHPEDIERRVREALHVIWKDNAEAIEQEACDILGVKSLREYFRKPALFFADHLKRYSKSRRQAPIYWPLSTKSGSYTLWLYYHRLTDQTLYTCVNDFVEPKLKQVNADAAHLGQKPVRSAGEERDLERLSDLEAELKDLRTELLRIAEFWKPNLNDGVQITAAPLWKLFSHRPWQKKLKETWDSLEAGEYDWAHLAYSIWPERVREKCKGDKSLAIAHDLERLYVEPPDGAKKKAGRKKKNEEMAQEEFDEG